MTSIGLTYDLRRDYEALGLTGEAVAEFDSEETIVALAGTLSRLGHAVERIGNIFALTQALAAGRRWDLVFNICEGVFGRSREAQVPALLEAYQIPYTFSDPLTLGLTLDKALAKEVVRAAGVPTPDFFVCREEADCAHAEAGRMAYPLFVKPLSEGTGMGITAASIVHSAAELRRQCALVRQRYHQPALVESFLPGREFTVGIVGTDEEARSIGIMEVCLLENAEPAVYSYRNKELCEDRVRYEAVRGEPLADQAEDVAVAAYRALGCRDAGRVDLRADGDGQLHFLEVNPLAGLHPTHSDLPILCSLVGLPYDQLIARIVASALARKTPALIGGQRLAPGRV